MEVGGGELGVVAGVADRRHVETRVPLRERPVGVGDGVERVATGAADHRRAQLVAEVLDGVQREIAQETVETVDVRVQRLAADPEPRRQRGQGQGVDAALVGQFGGRLDDRGVVQSDLRRHGAAFRGAGHPD